MSINDQPLRFPDREAFRCEISHEQGSTRVSTIGELDIATSRILQGEVDALRAAGCRRLVIDLSGLDFIDSTGLRCLLDFDAEARQDGFTMSLIPGPPEVQRVFELTNTLELLPFGDS